jgi:hypothetical protein
MRTGLVGGPGPGQRRHRRRFWTFTGPAGTRQRIDRHALCSDPGGLRTPPHEPHPRIRMHRVRSPRLSGMAGEWTGVVGTAIGAGIGGVVTITSLVVRGRQEAAREERRLAHEREAERKRLDVEEQRRGRDRAWNITMEGIAARRETYVRLLGKVASFSELLVTTAVLEPGDHAAMQLQADEMVRAMNGLVSEVDANSQHREVGIMLRRLLSRCHDLKSTSMAELPELVRAIQGLIEDLTNICRWDLGSYALPPPGRSKEATGDGGAGALVGIRDSESSASKHDL